MINISSEHITITRPSRKPLTHMNKQLYRCWSNNLCLNRRSNLILSVVGASVAVDGVTYEVVGVLEGWGIFVPPTIYMSILNCCLNINWLTSGPSSNSSKSSMPNDVWCTKLLNRHLPLVRIGWDCSPLLDMRVLYVISPRTTPQCSISTLSRFRKSNRAI